MTAGAPPRTPVWLTLGSARFRFSFFTTTTIEPREAVAEECIDLVIQVMEACRDDAEVLMEGLKAFYNFVFLCENNHILLSEKEVLQKIERWLEAYASDKEIIEVS